MGTGKTIFAKALFSEMNKEFNCAIATYQGELVEFFKAIAFQLQVPTEDEETSKAFKKQARTRHSRLRYNLKLTSGNNSSNIYKISSKTY